MKTKHSISNTEFIELSPVDVAKMLNISYNKARNLMNSNIIKSWISNDSSDKTRFKTNLMEIKNYQQKQLLQREIEVSKPKYKPVTEIDTGTLSTKSMSEFLKTEIFN